VVTRLKHAKLIELAETCEEATGRVKETGRAVEDAAEPVQDAIAQRDFWDGTADETTQELRLKLAARSVDAAKNAPYTQIFPQGIDYYIAAPLAQVSTRYMELVTRIETHLADDDELRGPAMDALAAAIEGFDLARAKVAEARTALSLARTERDVAQDEWETVMEKTFGLLVAEVGRKQANRFFPRVRRTSTEESDDAEDTATSVE
jgi:hypothetical protein